MTHSTINNTPKCKLSSFTMVIFQPPCLGVRADAFLFIFWQVALHNIYGKKQPLFPISQNPLLPLKIPFYKKHTILLIPSAIQPGQALVLAKIISLPVFTSRIHPLSRAHSDSIYCKPLLTTPGHRDFFFLCAPGVSRTMLLVPHVLVLLLVCSVSLPPVVNSFNTGKAPYLLFLLPTFFLSFL